MLEKLSGEIQGPIEVKGSAEIDGTVRGGAVVIGELDLKGTCDGPLEVRLDGRATVTGIVRGDVHARGGSLRIRGIIDGRLGIKDGADVQVAVGTVLNGKQLQEDGTFVTVTRQGRFSIPEDATMYRPQEDGNWTKVS